MTFCENGGTLLSVAAVTATGPRTPAAAVPTVETIQCHGARQPACSVSYDVFVLFFVRMENSTKPWRSGGKDC